MPYALGAINVQAGKTYNVSVGSAGTVGAVVIANESPYSVQASAGAGGQWIVAQTADLVACNVSGFNGTLTLTTDNYLSNAGSAPSFLLYLTAFAPGEAIRGTYPAPLMRLANGAIGVATQVLNDSSAVGTLVVETRPINQTQSFFALYNDGTADWWVLRSDGIAQEVFKVINQAGAKTGQLIFPGGFASTGSGAGVFTFDDGLGHLSTGTLTATAPVTLAAGNQETGRAGFRGGVNAGGDFFGGMVNFKTVMTNTPTSITLMVTVGTQNVSGVASATQISTTGFLIQWATSTASNTFWLGSYTTVGNCLLAVDGAGTFDHHCDACGHISTGTPFNAVTHGIQFDEPVMSYVCPTCGAVECFNTMLTSADEADTTPQGSGEYQTTRGAQATRIRQLMTALGLALA